jgi:hypothetical protein
MVCAPSIQRAQAAWEDDDHESFCDEMWEVAEGLDMNEFRLELAKAVIPLRDAGNVAPKLAAVAVFELIDGPGWTLLFARLSCQSSFGPAMYGAAMYGAAMAAQPQA